MLHRTRPRQFRTVFISDLHLGSRGCQPAHLLDFLEHHQADTIYLVGDVVDGWRLKKVWYWPQAHQDVVQRLLDLARAGKRIIYIPGNHDEFLRDFPGTHFGGVEVVEELVHEAADGRRYLVIHGDKFDVVVRHAPWLSMLGDGVYQAALAVNLLLNKIRRRLGLHYWSLSAWAKNKVKNAVSLIGSYEQALVNEAARHGVDGVICGHLHHAAMHEDFGLVYINTGDWVESCTGVVEHMDGRFEVIRWSKGMADLKTVKGREDVVDRMAG